MAAIATTPTTTPAAMPALLGLDEPPPVEGVGEAVTTIVCAWPPIVTTDGVADCVLLVGGVLVGPAVADDDDDEEPPKLGITFFTPAFHTLQYIWDESVEPHIS